MSEISFDIEDYDLLEAFQEVERSSSSAPQGIELKELTGDEAPSDEEPSDSEPEEQSKKVKTPDASYVAVGIVVPLLGWPECMENRLF